MVASQNLWLTIMQKKQLNLCRQAHFLFFDELDFDNAGAIKNILREVFSVNI